MADLATLQAQTNTLVAALGRNVLRVTVEGQTIEYRSVAELRAAIEETERLIRSATPASGGRKRMRVIHVPGIKHL